MKITIDIDAKAMARSIEKHKKELEEMKKKEIIDIKRVYEMGVQAGIEFQKAIQNMKVEQVK